MEYLGFWVTCKGVWPVNTKFEAILNMDPQKEKWGVQKFIGMINYYSEKNLEGTTCSKH